MRVNDATFLFVTELLSAVRLPGSHGELELELELEQSSPRKEFMSIRHVYGLWEKSPDERNKADMRFRNLLSHTNAIQIQSVQQIQDSTDQLFEFEISPKKSGFAALSLPPPVSCFRFFQEK